MTRKFGLHRDRAAADVITHSLPLFVGSGALKTHSASTAASRRRFTTIQSNPVSTAAPAITAL